MLKHSSLQKPQEPQEWEWSSEETPVRIRIWQAIRYYAPAICFLGILIGSAVAWIVLEWEDGAEKDPIVAGAIPPYAASPGGEAEPLPVSTYTQSPASLSVSSYPAGAIVYIDAEFAGVTPLIKYPVDSGVHIVALRDPLHAAIDTVIAIGEYQAADVFMLLRRVAESGTDLESADFFASSHDEAQDALQVTFRGSDNAAQGRGTRAGRDARSARNAAAATGSRNGSSSEPSFGKLWISSNPAGATVWLDGRERGRTPLVLRQVPTGVHRLELRAEGYARHLTDVTLRPHRNNSLYIQLVRSESSEEDDVKWRKKERLGW